MIRPIVRLTASFVIACVVAGCGKKAAEDPTAAAATTEESAPSAAPAAGAPAAPTPTGQEVLPGSSSVRAAIARKDYDAAVGGLLALKGAAQRSPQSEEYATLYDEVKFALLDASATDQKAATALMTLRAASAGR